MNRMKQVLLVFSLAAATVLGNVAGLDARSYGPLLGTGHSSYKLESGSCGDGLELMKVEFISQTDNRDRLAVVKYRCSRDVRVRAYLQKIELGTGVVLDNRKIYEYSDPLSSSGVSRSIACRIDRDNGFDASGIYSIVLEAEERGSSETAGFVTFYYDAEKGSVSMGTSGVRDSLMVSAGFQLGDDRISEAQVRAGH